MPNTITTAEAAAAIHHLESAREILQRIGANVASAAVTREAFGQTQSSSVRNKAEAERVAPSNYLESAEYAVELFAERRQREDRLLYLLYALRDHMEPETGGEASDSMALGLVEISIGLMEENSTMSMIANCLEALKREEVAK